MTNEVLEEICNICNVYDVLPKKVLSIYNRAISKDYVNKDWVKAIQLTERYIGQRYDLKPTIPKWQVVKYEHYDFKRD